jgi:hypothetical protein
MALKNMLCMLPLIARNSTYTHLLGPTPFKITSDMYIDATDIFKINYINSSTTIGTEKYNLVNNLSDNGRTVNTYGGSPYEYASPFIFDYVDNNYNQVGSSNGNSAYGDSVNGNHLYYPINSTFKVTIFGTNIVYNFDSKNQDCSSMTSMINTSYIHGELNNSNISNALQSTVAQYISNIIINTPSTKFTLGSGTITNIPASTNNNNINVNNMALNSYTTSFIPATHTLTLIKKNNSSTTNILKATQVCTTANNTSQSMTTSIPYSYIIVSNSSFLNNNSIYLPYT